MPAEAALLAAFRKRWGRPLNLLRIACVVLPAVLFCGLAWIDYRIELERTRNDVRTAANALAGHARTVVETADLVIDRVLEHIGSQDWGTLANSLETHEFLDRLRHDLPQVEAVYLVDPNGVLAASSRAYPMPRFDVHTAEYFAAPKAGDSDRSVISAPSAETKSHTAGFMISRRRSANGAFDGVVGVTVARQYFDDYYRSVLDVPDASVAVLMRTDGAILVRFPDAPGAQTFAAADGPVMRALRAGQQSGVLSGQSSVDHQERITAFRKLPERALLVAYAIGQSVVLRTWASHALVIGICAVLLSVLLLATERLVRRQTAIEHDALRRLVEETERRREAEARAQQGQKMEALGRLTGGVAHDFNNLLAVILGSLELVLRRETDARSTRLLRTATAAAERGAKLTAQMLAFSRKQEVVVRPVDVNAVIQGMDDLLRRTLGPSVRLHFELGEHLWPARAATVQLELALLNLSVNARDAMPDGGDLTFRTSALAGDEAVKRTAGLQPGDYVCVQVIDTGVGMTEEVRARAQEPFFTTKGPGGGTGLGLSMVAGFVSEVGGAMTLDGAVGAGTTVSLYLCRAEAEADTVLSPDAADDALPARAGRVLLVDDDNDVRISVRAMLEDLGHGVVEASGGAEALGILAQDRRFDLLIVDFAMPVMNGVQFAERVTGLWLEAPMLFVTGYVENDALRPWLERGYRSLQKPFDMRELALAVERTMRHSETATI